MEKQKSSHYKYCIVPLCKNTTIRTPNKIFFQVPKNAAIRKKWCDLMKRDLLSSSTSSRHCCEDHFNLEEDMMNYWQYKLVNATPRLKVDAFPHKYDCQKLKRSHEEEKKVVAKRKRLDELIEEVSASTKDLDSKPSTSTIYASVTNEVTVKIEEVQEISKEDKNIVTFVDKAVQVNLQPHYRSKATNTNTVVKDLALSPLKHNQYILISDKDADLDTNSRSSSSDLDVKSGSSSPVEEISKIKFDNSIETCTSKVIETEPCLILGLP